MSPSGFVRGCTVYKQKNQGPLIVGFKHRASCYSEFYARIPNCLGFNRRVRAVPVWGFRGLGLSPYSILVIQALLSNSQKDLKYKLFVSPAGWVLRCRMLSVGF